MQHKKNKERKKNIKLKMFIAGVVLASCACLFVVLLYVFGGIRLRAAADSGGPNASLLTEAEETEEVRKKAGLATVQWQENWVALDGKVYAYDDSCINLLVLGIDKPGKIGNDETDYETWGAGQADAIFLISINPTQESIRLIGIPRNTMMDIDIYDAEGHISETIFDQICLQYPFAGGGRPGLEAAKEKVSGLLYGLPIHGGFAVGFDAMKEINDMVGGVDVIALESLETKYGSFNEGEMLHLEGEFVLAYVRGRNMDILGSPTMRLERQKQYLTALLGKAKAEAKRNPAIIRKMYGAVSEYMNTDVMLDEAVYLAAQAAAYQFDGDSICLLRGEDRAVPIVVDGIETEDYYDEYYLDEESLKETMIGMFYTEVVLGGQE